MNNIQRFFPWRALPSPISVVNKPIEEDRWDYPEVPMEEDWMVWSTPSNQLNFHIWLLCSTWSCLFLYSIYYLFILFIADFGNWWNFCWLRRMHSRGTNSFAINYVVMVAPVEWKILLSWSRRAQFLRVAAGYEEVYNNLKLFLFRFPWLYPCIWDSASLSFRSLSLSLQFLRNVIHREWVACSGFKCSIYLIYYLLICVAANITPGFHCLCF